MFNQIFQQINYRIKLQFIIVILSLLAIVTAIFFYILKPNWFDIPLLVAILAGGIPLLFEISFDFLKGDLGSDLLAAIALVTAVVLHQYFAAVMIILMLSSGQTLEAYAMRKASSVLSVLAERMPNLAHRKVNGKIQDIPLIDVRVGDQLVVYPHEACPVDGYVLEGRGSMDESYLTGEPYHISKAPGAIVLSGAINNEVALVVQTEKLPADSRYAEIVAVLRETEQKKPEMRRLADQIGAWFAPLALIFSVAVWYLSHDAIRFLSVLVIATPCPLLIAIPITIISAISMAAKKSIIIKDPVVLERLPTCKTAIFDKTGTLTYGMPKLNEILIAENISADRVLQYAASLERYSKHPLAKAILDELENKSLKLLEVTKIQEKAGEGLSGLINHTNVIITSRKHIMHTYPKIVESLPPVTTGLECIILFNHQYAATLKFQDVPRQESKSFIGHLAPSHQFSKVMLVSGDREQEVETLGNKLGLKHIYASQSPEQKLVIVNEETQNAPTLFMGDGINDAPALAAATVGIAFGHKSNIPTAAAGAVIMDSTLTKVDELIHLSLATRKIALQSAIGGMLLSLMGMGFAAAGYISPVAGSILQEIIDIIAIANALRLIFSDEVRADF